MSISVSQVASSTLPGLLGAPSRPRPVSGARSWWPVAGAALGGALNALAFPGAGLWPLVFVGTPLLLFGATSRRLPVAFVSALVGGFTFWAALTPWLMVYLGPAPWLALSVLEALIFTGGVLLVTLAWRWATTVIAGRRTRLVVAPPIIGGLWTLQEGVASRWPYGGFSWGRLAFSQSSSPFGDLSAWVGVSGLSFLIAAFGALLVVLVRDGWVRRPVAVVLPSAALIGLLLVPPFPVTVDGSLRIGAVQGNSSAGLLAENQPGDILADHVAATESILSEPMDVLIWPENASDLNPLIDAGAAEALDRIGRAVNAPIVAGTITRDGDETFNSLLRWEPGVGATAQYDKRHPVPFAEYLPDRDFWYPLAPDLFSLIPREVSLGSRPNVFDVAGVSAGLAICFDIVDDDLIREMVTSGAQLILAPSNNADFGRTQQSSQQLSIARMRAIEAGRSLVNISTVGKSTVVDPHGGTIDSLPTFTAGAMVNDVPLSTTSTPAIEIGREIELAVTMLAALATLTMALLARPKRRGTACRPNPLDRASGVPLEPV